MGARIATCTTRAGRSVFLSNPVPCGTVEELDLVRDLLKLEPTHFRREARSLGRLSRPKATTHLLSQVQVTSGHGKVEHFFFPEERYAATP